MNQRRAPSDLDEHLLLPPDAAAGDMDVPQSRYWHLLDYILVWSRYQQDELVTKEIPGADGRTDNHLVISKIRLCPQLCRSSKGKLPQGKLNTVLFDCACSPSPFQQRTGQPASQPPSTRIKRVPC
ncbi:unnamed protein product [Schistocephalus solidus]|uniref:Uncharacterized protein n=1 Tax=Schistocephalus solidus TaxID=70667 RepID=A0A183T1B7_SCHSO|nr:unnamed protein product [Schistocephalus solidus]